MVTDGSAVLGLGNLGPLAALPVMEGKAALFKRFAGIDAFPICLDTQDVDEIVATVKAIAPVFAGINLEDISAPRCFEIEERLRAELDIPVFHDDQHGTAIVTLAALTNALTVVGKDLSYVRIVMAGAGAAGTAVAAAAARPPARRTSSSPTATASCTPAATTSTRRRAGRRSTPTRAASPARWSTPWPAPTCSSASPRRTSSPATTSRRWTTARSCSRWPTRCPEVDPVAASRHAAVVATGRSDFANQINNVLAFPGVFRGLLDAQSTTVTTDLLLAAAYALAGVVTEDELNAAYIVPSVFHPDVSSVVAAAVEKAAGNGHHRRP